MNEITNYSASQLPDNLQDLTQFVLIGKAKLQAYMLKLQTVNKLSVAQEIRDQTLQEAQEISTALIAAEQRIGELLLAIPKSSGGDHGNQYTSAKNRDGSNFGKTKSETIKEMGYSKDEASDYQQMAKNPEIVQLVINTAVANGDVVTKTQVMKKIKEAKKEQKEKYESLLNKEENNSNELIDLREKYDEATRKITSYEEEITRLRTRRSPGIREADTAYDFWIKVNSFVKNTLAPFHYDEIVTNNLENSSGRYIEEACSLLIEAATDILRRFETKDVIDMN